MFKPLYHWMLDKAAHPRAGTWLAFVSSLESFIFPLPPDLMLIPMALAKPERAFWFATLCTVGAIIGAAIGYAIGMFFFDLIGVKIIDLFGQQQGFTELQTLFTQYDALVILAAAITPIPFKIATITAGFVGSNFTVFLIAGLIGRSIRYGLIALLIALFGDRIKAFLEKNLNLALTAFFVLFALGWLFIL